MTTNECIELLERYQFGDDQATGGEIVLREKVDEVIEKEDFDYPTACRIRRFVDRVPKSTFHQINLIDQYAAQRNVDPLYEKVEHAIYQGLQSPEAFASTLLGGIEVKVLEPQ